MLKSIVLLIKLYNNIRNELTLFYSICLIIIMISIRNANNNQFYRLIQIKIINYNNFLKIKMNILNK